MTLFKNLSNHQQALALKMFWTLRGNNEALFEKSWVIFQAFYPEEAKVLSQDFGGKKPSMIWFSFFHFGDLDHDSYRLALAKLFGIASEAEMKDLILFYEVIHRETVQAKLSLYQPKPEIERVQEVHWIPDAEQTIQLPGVRAVVFNTHYRKKWFHLKVRDQVDADRFIAWLYALYGDDVMQLKKPDGTHPVLLINRVAQQVIWPPEVNVVFLQPKYNKVAYA